MPTIRKQTKQKTKIVKKKQPKNRPTIWEGPEGTGLQGGVTQSLLNRWLCCRERFRLKVVEGLQPADTFSHALEYGQMWHTCEEAFASGRSWVGELHKYTLSLCKKYKFQQEQIQHWYNVCKTQFPIYIEYWSKHPDVKSRTPLFQEETFNVPYKLPSGRTVHLRGKFDSVDIIGKGKSAGVYLQENKTKGQVNEQQLRTQLGFDLQTMIYLSALNYIPAKRLKEKPILGIRYNVIRRPLSGGKGSIRKHKPTKANPTGETDEQYYARLAEIIEEDPSSYFMRWKVEVTSADLKKFQDEFLNNVLEELCDWWNWISSPAGRKNPFDDPIHFRLPYGIYNVIAEGGSSDLDEYLATKSEIGLTRNNQLFGELI